MKRMNILIAMGAFTLSACNASGDGDGSNSTAVQADKTASGVVAGPEKKIAPPAPTDNLMKITCADFLGTAAVAVDASDVDAAKAAQDELANGLTWLHGYLYATKKGELPDLSQDWMKTTVTTVHANCKAATDPAKLSLFEVATS